MVAKSKSSAASRKQSPGSNELLMLELQQIYSAENQLARALPQLMKPIQSESFRELVGQRQEEGERILQELERAFEELAGTPGRRKNIAAEGLINETHELASEIEEGPALDSVLIAGIQKTEHYCIAAWGTARSLAQALGQKATVRAMERALGEGKSLDEQLTRLAEQEITPSLLGLEAEEKRETEAAGGNNAPSGASQLRS